MSELIFCMIPTKKSDGKFNIYPLPQKYCHCQDTETKHFAMYGKYNDDKTNMIPTNVEDMEKLEEYCKQLTTEAKV